MTLSQLARALGKASVLTRDVNAVDRVVRTGSLLPLLKRLGNRLLGRGSSSMMRRLWFR